MNAASLDRNEIFAIKMFDKLTFSFPCRKYRLIVVLTLLMFVAAYLYVWYMREFHITNHLHTMALNEFDCTKLLSSDSKEMEKAIDYLEGKNKQFAHLPSIQYDTMEKLAGRETPKAKGVQLPYGTEEDTDFPVAFYIPFHENVVQLQRLLYIIHRPQNIYCVHVDDKLSSKDFEAVYRIANCYKNVFLTSRREIMVYGSVTEIRAELNCMEDLDNSGHRWKYLIHFTAKSFPLMTNSELVEALKSHKGKNIVHSNWPEEHIQFKRRHILVVEQITKSGYIRHTQDLKSKPPFGIMPTSGFSTNVFTREFVDWVLVDTKAKEVLNWMSDIMYPAQYYWATLNNLYHNGILQTPGGDCDAPGLKQLNFYLIGWNVPADRKLCRSGHYVRNTCVFSVQDLATLTQRRELVANKFDISYDPIVYMCMEQWITNKTRGNHL
ncbi:GCNT1-like protein [Mya arenaria]|uniref:GCNT1-like protein n=1 Tax=Mya arenaria TaxID=6604 RepID=A0ABY7DYC9_MYAAR|nr:GCNT1-like protein [Mya arenaria]